MEESNNYGHQHPLLLILNQDQLIQNQSGVTHCSRCGEKVSAPCFCCAEHCGFYLHKVCAEAPLELNHPFHPHHPLLLLQNAPYSSGRYICNFCDKGGNEFNNLKELEHVALQDEELEDDNKCFGFLFKLNHGCHRKHPLVLQFNSQRLSCKICRVTRRSTESGFFYGCSPCKFVVHIECASQSPLRVIKSTNHEHPFTLFNEHQHPLFLMLNQEQLIDNQSGVTDCSRCGDKVSAPCFYCAEHCGFYLHKVCAEAPLELNHPFHLNHPLLLMQKSPHLSGAYFCTFCHEFGDKSVYHCSSCELDFHIKCALFTLNIAENNLKELEHVALHDPLISTENGDKKLKDVSKCFGCQEPLANYTHFSPYRGFNLHEKCAKIPFKLNHVCHRKHPLILQFNSKRLSCKVCQVPRRRGFVYGCSPCKFVVHIECASQSSLQVIKNTNHEHPFTLFLRQVPFTCDACGTEGNHVSYTCGTCSIIIHKNCISLPRIINSKWHDHPLIHTYFHHIEDFRVLDCLIYHDKVNIEHGSYCCSKCDVIYHDKDSYEIVENEDEMPHESSISVIERNDAGEATKIKHFKHMHNLMLGPFVGRYENSCNGCMLPISDPFYYCSECVFFLHKACAELTKMKNVWHHHCQEPFALISDKAFECQECWHISNAFAYECSGCEENKCLRCVIALTPGARTCLKHVYPLYFYRDYEGQCNACGDTTRGYRAFCCKDCNFVLDLGWFSLPIIARHKCDDHLLSLTDNDDNSYSKSHHCDICEESRDAYRWFYHCTKCDTSAHVGCVLGSYPFLKLGSIYEETNHPHPLIIVKKKYYYLDCYKCGKPCEDVALECSKLECKYIVYWDCVAPYFLRHWWKWGM
ncbi:hypothetical protein ES288_D02G015900v1 [Gossypium darwinii]|uniref:Zinc finger PHD-type domain-containing protein n=1 Tax=Gossypium darwinii TaxID=34276 RepID=A0A5D2DA46_GOSDA|nr:hypothetical protein ES288_D02G015900v1 [Gossypium darwinii]